MSDTKNGSDASYSGKDEYKRQRKLTFKALAEKIHKLQKEWQTNINKIKVLIQSAKELMQKDDNASLVKSQLEHSITLLHNATQQHKAVILLLPKEQREKKNEWFARIRQRSSGFIEDVKVWLFELGRPLPDNINVPAESRLHVSGNDQQLQDEIRLSDIKMPDTVTQDEIKPSDSVSNVGSGKSGRQSSAGSKCSGHSHSSSKRSIHSTTSSACIKAEADMAALIARQRLLKEKLDLEQQEVQLRKRKELELQVEIEASMAEVNVLFPREMQHALCDPSQVLDKTQFHIQLDWHLISGEAVL